MKSKVDTCISIYDAKITIEKMSRKFDSHEFIKTYSDLFSLQYKDLVSQYRMVGSAHALIGSFLSKFSKDLRIESIGRAKSINVNGDKTECELWKKW